MEVLALTAGQAYEEPIREMGVKVTWVGENPSRRKRLWSIVQRLRERPAPIIQSAHFYTNLYAAVTGRLVGAASVGAIRNDVFSELNANPAFGWGDLMLPTHLIANSRIGKERAIAKGRSPQRVHVLQNVVDDRRFPVRGSDSSEKSGDAPARFNIDGQSEIRLLFAGRLVDQKRPDWFLEAVGSLKQEVPGLTVRAQLAGDGPLRPKLQALALALGLTCSEAEFLGEEQAMAPLYQWADMLIVPSDHEGTPNVILEAMSAGLPVVATAVGGVPDLLARGGGLMVRPEHKEPLFRSIARLAQDRELRLQLGREGRRYVKANHSLEGLDQRLLAIYARIIEGRL